MPVLRVFLECTAPTGRPRGAFDTFVRVSEEELVGGSHLRIACRRAAILGFGGPHRVLEVRRFGAPSVTPTVVDDTRPRLETRLLAALARAAEAAVGPAVMEVPSGSPLPRPARGRSRARAV
jgi:hypothetical protein